VQLNATDSSVQSSPHEAVLDYWFGTITDGFAPEERRQRWCAPSPDVDAEIATRFEGLIEQAAVGALDHWTATARGALAFVLVTDQFPRQVYRGTARAFATDALALAVARAAVEAGFDRRLAFDERAFVYLPFEHAESAAAQAESVRLFTALRDDTPRGRRHLTGDYLHHAHVHRDLIARFGRFPHRNAVLDRPSTPEEVDYLRTATGFGQRAPVVDEGGT